MLQLLDPGPGDRVLDVGAGSGWTTALLGHLVGPTGRVTGVELVPELAAWGAENLARHAMDWTRIETADPDELGVPSRGPYDRILVSAEAATVPPALVAQLAVGGRMVIPVAEQMLVVDRLAPDGEIEVSRHGVSRSSPDRARARSIPRSVRVRRHERDSAWSANRPGRSHMATTTTTELIDLETRSWEVLAVGGEECGAYYEEVLDAEPVILMPGGFSLTDRDTIVQSMGGAPWAGVPLEDMRVTELSPTAAVVTYGAVARRDE